MATRKGCKKNALYTLGKAVFVNTYCSIVISRHKPIKSQEVRMHTKLLHEASSEGPKFGFATKTYLREPTHAICILDFSHAIKHTKSQMVEHFLLLSICF